MIRVISIVRQHGFHCWPDAPSIVSHLAQRHRHLFTFRVEVPVMHDDRDVEFQLVQSYIRDSIEEKHESTQLGIEFGSRSCEMLARELMDDLGERFDVWASAVEVWEDDECGARLEKS